MADAARQRPNILLVVSDQERQRSLVPAAVRCPGGTACAPRASSSPATTPTPRPARRAGPACSPAATCPGHGVVDNVIMPEHSELDPPRPTLGSLLDGAGYRSSYIGKWHLSHVRPPRTWRPTASPTGTATTATSWAGPAPASTSIPIIASNAAHWLARQRRRRTTAGRPADPWFLDRRPGQPPRRDVVPGRPARLPASATPRRWRGIRAVLEAAAWKDDDPLPVYTDAYAEVVDAAPGQLRRRPAHQARGPPPVALGPAARPVGLHRPGRHQRPGSATSTTTCSSTGWPTAASARCSPRSRPPGRWDDTVVIFTSDHGDMCGSHGLRSKGPFVYDEIMRVPLYVKVPGRHHAAAR